MTSDFLTLLKQHRQSARIDLGMALVQEANIDTLSLEERFAGFQYLTEIGLFARALEPWFHPAFLKDPGAASRFLTCTTETGRTELLEQPALVAHFTKIGAHPTLRQSLLGVLALLARRAPDSPFFSEILNKVILRVLRDLSEPGLAMLTSALLSRLPLDQVAKTLLPPLGASANTPPLWFARCQARQDTQSATAYLQDLNEERLATLLPSQDHVAVLPQGLYREKSLSLTDALWSPGRAMDETILRRVAQDMHDDAVSLIKEPGPISKLSASLRSQGMKMVQIISTGRVGTKSLHDFLKDQDAYQPFHAFEWHNSAGDRNRLLYAYLIKSPTRRQALATILHRLLQDRGLELLASHRLGKIPVMINHLDGLFAPLYLAILGNLSFVEMRREPEKTLISLSYKGQFGYRQIRPLSVIATQKPFPNNLVFSTDISRSIEADCLWYMRFTDTWFRALKHLPGTPKCTTLPMDKIFATPENAHAHLETAFADLNDDARSTTRHFSRVINAKRQRDQDHELFDPARARRLIETL